MQRVTAMRSFLEPWHVSLQNSRMVRQSPKRPIDQKWNTTCAQLTLALPTKKSGHCLFLNQRLAGSAVKAADATTRMKDLEIRASRAGYFEELTV